MPPVRRMAQDDELIPVFRLIPIAPAIIPRPTGTTTFRLMRQSSRRFYRWRYFMMAQERDRYRYMPHIFHGYSDGDRIDDVDIQGISAGLRNSYSD